MVVLGLLAVPLTVYVAGSRAPNERSVFERAVLTAAAPLQRVVVWGVDGVQELWYGYIYLVGLREENEALRLELAEGKGRLSTFEDLEDENRRLRDLVELGTRRPERTVVAQVIAVGGDPSLARTVHLGRGSEAGVEVGHAVIAHAGAVGRIVAVGRGWSELLLASDPNSQIAAQSVRSRARGTVKGTGDMATAALTGAVRTDDFKTDDLLVTAGTGGVFPRGIPLGVIEEVRRGDHGLFLEAQLRLEVDLERLDEVLILRERPPAWEPGG